MFGFVRFGLGLFGSNSVVLFYFIPSVDIILVKLMSTPFGSRLIWITLFRVRFEYDSKLGSFCLVMFGSVLPVLMSLLLLFKTALTSLVYVMDVVINSLFTLSKVALPSFTIFNMWYKFGEQKSCTCILSAMLGGFWQIR